LCVEAGGRKSIGGIEDACGLREIRNSKQTRITKIEASPKFEGREKLLKQLIRAWTTPLKRGVNENMTNLNQAFLSEPNFPIK
jgi:hypothetical protein